MRFKWSAIWLAVNAIFLVVPPVLIYRALDAKYRRLEAAGDWHDLTRADSLHIAVVSAFVIFFALSILNVIGYCGCKVWKLMKSRA